MNINILTSSFKELVYPLAAAVVRNEGMDFNSIRMAVNADGDTQYLNLMAQQPTFMVHVSQPLNIGDEGSAIDCEAVADADGICYALDNKLLLSMLRNISNANIDLSVTSDGMDLYAGDSHFYLEAERLNEGIVMPRYAMTADEVDNERTFQLIGTFAPGALPMLLEPAIRMARSAGREACLKSKAVHMIFGVDRFVTVEGMSNVGMISMMDHECFAYAEGMDANVRHYAIPLTAAERLLSMAKISGREVHVAYDEAEARLIAWCNPFCISILTEDVEMCNTPLDIMEMLCVDLPVDAMTSALSKIKATGNDKVILSIAPTGGIEVMAPNGKFSCAFAERLQGQLQATERLLLPLNALLAVMRGYEDDKVVMWFDQNEPYVKLESKHNMHDGFVLKM